MTNSTFTFGVLFSQTGTMSVTEKAHLQGVILAVEEINNQGGVKGRLLDPIIMDPQSDAATYAKLTVDLLLKQKVNVIFGCCLSSCRKRVLPVVERFNGILFYPSVYEGFEYSPNVIYGGATPNQIIIPLLKYLFAKDRRKYALVGSDTLFSREINRIVEEFLEESGGEIVSTHYIPIGTPKEGFRAIVREACVAEPDILLSTFVGLDNQKFYECCGEDDSLHKKPKIASLTVTESELLQFPEEARSGHLTAAAYFSTQDEPANIDFVQRFHAKFGADAAPSVYAQTTYNQVHMLARCLQFAYSDNTEDLLTALAGMDFRAPGGKISLDAETNHMNLPCAIGESRADGQFKLLWECNELVKPDPYLTSYDRVIVT